MDTVLVQGIRYTSWNQATAYLNRKISFGDRQDYLLLALCAGLVSTRLNGRIVWHPNTSTRLLWTLTRLPLI